MRRQNPILVAAVLAAILSTIFPGASVAEEPVTLTIQDHAFDPREVQVPAGQDFTIVVKNLDPSPEEFESHDLRIEKVILGGQEASFKVHALKKGFYKFIGEFHQATASGVIVAR